MRGGGGESLNEAVTSPGLVVCLFFGPDWLSWMGSNLQAEEFGYLLLKPPLSPCHPPSHNSWGGIFPPRKSLLKSSSCSCNGRCHVTIKDGMISPYYHSFILPLVEDFHSPVIYLFILHLLCVLPCVSLPLNFSLGSRIAPIHSGIGECPLCWNFIFVFPCILPMHLCALIQLWGREAILKWSYNPCCHQYPFHLCICIPVHWVWDILTEIGIYAEFLKSWFRSARWLLPILLTTTTLT